MYRNRSINFKIISLFSASCLLLLLVTAWMQYRHMELSDSESARAFRKSNLLVQQSVLTQQNRILDEALIYILNYAEVTKLAENPRDDNARLIVSGMYTSLEQEKNMTRFIVYDKEFQVIAQHHEKSLPDRSNRLAGNLEPLFRESAAKLNNVTYYRGAEGANPPFPVEYCGATVLTDKKDKPIGYVEVALPPEAWVTEISELTRIPAALLDPQTNRFVFASDPQLYEEIGKQRKGAQNRDGSERYRMEGIHYLSDCIPLLGPDKVPVSWLWLTQDNTGPMKDRQRSMIQGTLLFLALSAGSIGVAWFLLRRSIIRPVQTAIDGLTESVLELSKGAGEMHESSRSLAEGANTQAASLEETSSTLEEIATTTRQNAENAGQANQLMQGAAEVVQRATASFGYLRSSIQGIAEASSKTSGIIKTIDGIAFQTNLLALNASVEAARAGEAGAGFAVVANEVRNLALRAADAAQDTSGLIEATVTKIEEGQERLKAADQSLSEIIDRTGKVGGLVGEIASACAEQADGISQVNRAVSQIDQVIQQNAVSANGSADLSAVMNHGVGRIQDLVEMLEAVIRGGAKEPS
jgi:methyl-accepting chemotaxis protein